MSRNSSTHFDLAPQVEVRRSKFSRNSRHLTTFNTGDLVPIYLDEVLPGDTFKMKVSKLVRMTTSIHPTMDNAFIDTYFFYVPMRLLWEHWEEFNGASSAPWIQTKNYEIPQFSLVDDSVDPGSLMDYFGFNTVPYVELKRNVLPFRAYAKIVNDWFRDENLQSDIAFTLDDGVVSFSDGEFLINNLNPQQAGSCFKVGKFHDYFTSSLPGPQKHSDVLIPTGTADISIKDDLSNVTPYFQTKTGDNGTGSLVAQVQDGIPFISGSNAGLQLYFNPNGSLEMSGLEITVNQLRLAIQTQRLFEKDARGGTRYNEIIKAHFGVTSPDARLQRSEYLGGKRTPINMAEVIQTSPTQTGTTPLGSLAGNSATGDVEDGFVKSFVEHGYIIGLACVRTEQTYSQGFERLWNRKDRLDFYWPVLANIGEQPVLNSEIFYVPSKRDSVIAGNTNYEVFGYQEAWAEYRYKPNRLSGYFRPDAEESLSSWHYGVDFAKPPVLGDSFIRQGVEEMDRTLAVQSSVAHQFIGDFYFDCECVRPMPLYSIPGLMDHF